MSMGRNTCRTVSGGRFSNGGNYEKKSKVQRKVRERGRKASQNALSTPEKKIRV